MTRTVRLDGRRIQTPEDFYREIGEAVNGPGGYFGTNLDALADCLRGGFGTDPDESVVFEWRHSEFSRLRLRGVTRGGTGFVEAVRAVFEDAGVTLRLR